MTASLDYLPALSNALAEAVTHAARSVVAVNGGHRFSASGVVWREGLIVTAEHALRRDEEIAVTLPDNRTIETRLAGRDPGTDLAVLQGDFTGHPAAEFADPASLQVGNMVLALGRRGENGPAATLGVISAISGPWRTWRGGHVDRFVRPDVSLYPGLPGGPLADIYGRIIGINTSVLTRNVGVTVPALTVERVIADLLSKGHVARGYLGVGLHPVQLPDGRAGLIVLSVEPNAPAGKAGVLIGDVLTALDGKDVADTDDVQGHLGPDNLGRNVKASIFRGGSAIQLDIAIGERPQGGR